ncbi:RING-H2 finger protein ATL74-like [Lolium rigidum]|uniref:RING-H2 finger protein ATL74-like n=1 Tax=Lolium rigidum TaxID=89674 RepID=UPI001F5C2FB8|nr:RING-H2 finger protein ATL74-like [Lolium rigidum]
MVAGSAPFFIAPGVTVMLVACVLVILWALRRGAGARAAAHQERALAAEDGGGKGLSADELQALPCHDFFSDGAAAADCSVCLEAFEAGERCRRLPRCGHSFHARCVDPWLEKSRFCPVCRADVVPVEPEGELVKVAGEGTLAEPALAAEMALDRRNAATLEIVVIERLQQYSWTLHPGVLLR